MRTIGMATILTYAPRSIGLELSVSWLQPTESSHLI